LQFVQAIFVVTLENWNKTSTLFLFLLFNPGYDQGWHLLQFTAALAVCVYLWIYWAVSTGITGAQEEIWSCSLLLCLQILPLMVKVEYQRGSITPALGNQRTYRRLSRLVFCDVALSLW